MEAEQFLSQSALRVTPGPSWQLGNYCERTNEHALQIHILGVLYPGQGAWISCRGYAFILFLFLQRSPNNNNDLHAEFNPE